MVETAERGEVSWMLAMQTWWRRAFAETASPKTKGRGQRAMKYNMIEVVGCSILVVVRGSERDVGGCGWQRVRVVGSEGMWVPVIVAHVEVWVSEMS